MSAMVGAYLCPRGAFLVEVKTGKAGFEVLRVVENSAHLDTADAAARHLVNALSMAGITRAEVAVAVRGFGTGHHTISLPPAREAMLAPIIQREMRRLEPALLDPAVGWLGLPGDEPSPDMPPQRHLLVAAIPRDVVELFEVELRGAGHKLHHVTALPAALQRLVEEFDPSRATSTYLAPLPDGLFLGLFLAGGLRIAIEPPPYELEALDGTAMAEEAELGATYVRQQFRGAQVERAVIMGPAALWADAQKSLGERLGVPVHRLDLDGLSAAAVAALGAVLDARSPAPLALGGEVARRRQSQAGATLRQTARAAVAAAAVVGVWAMLQAFDARRADDELRRTQRRLEQMTFDVGPIRQTAEQRRLVRDATAMLRLVRRDRGELQNALASISAGIGGPIRLDSLALERASNGWLAAVAGTALGATSGAAVQSLHDFYRDIPRRLVVEELALEQLAYADTVVAGGRAAIISFLISFVVPERQD